jgi:hypothetical protein
MSSDNISNARNKLDILGYVHPETLKYNKNDPYKTINVKDEKGIYVSSSKLNDPYNRLSITPEKNEVQKNNICPSCQEEALFICSCEEFKDLMCKNNHYWWINSEGITMKGDPHEND